MLEGSFSSFIQWFNADLLVASHRALFLRRVLFVCGLHYSRLVNTAQITLPTLKSTLSSECLETHPYRMHKRAINWKKATFWHLWRVFLCGMGYNVLRRFCDSGITNEQLVAGGRQQFVEITNPSTCCCCDFSAKIW